MRLSPVLILGMVAVIAAVVAGCTMQETPPAAPPVTIVPQQTEAPMMTVVPQPTAMPPAVVQTMVPQQVTTPVVAAAYSVMWADTSVGRVLTDRHGMTLYYYVNDAPFSETSTCYDACAALWRPYYAGSPMTLSPPLDATLFATIQRSDVTSQTTYRGWPLYTYSGDSGPGSTLGNGFAGQWYAASVSGTIPP